MTARTGKSPTKKQTAPKPAVKSAARKTSTTASTPKQTTAPRLVILGGLPGTGKTTVARALAQILGATHLRVDTIEHALRTSLGADFELKALGYRAAYALAEDNLRLGRSVVADSVNPWGVTRAAWLRVASRAGVEPLEVEMICGDKAEHRRRIEDRKPEPDGQKPPTWDDVLAHLYEPWTRDRLVIDTAECSANEGLTEIMLALAATPAAKK